MKFSEIIETTPKKGVIYAIGSVPESHDTVYYPWEPWNWKARHYSPAYVLRKGQASSYVLVAKYPPEYRVAKEGEAPRWDHEAPKTPPQASMLDAFEYGVNDFDARMEVLTRYSHWPLSKEQQAEREAALTELKPLPQFWEIKNIRNVDIRMLWAAYDHKMFEAQEKRDEAKVAENKRKNDNIETAERIKKLVKRTKVLGKDGEKKLSFHEWDNEVRVPLWLLEDLLLQYVHLAKLEKDLAVEVTHIGEGVDDGAEA